MYYEINVGHLILSGSDVLILLALVSSGQVYQQYQAPGGYPPQQPGAPPQQQYGMQYPGKTRHCQHFTRKAALLCWKVAPFSLE